MLKILKNVQTSEILPLFGYSKEFEIFENVANIVVNIEFVLLDYNTNFHNILYT